jgi:hypothetical protein
LQLGLYAILLCSSEFGIAPAVRNAVLPLAAALLSGMFRQPVPQLGGFVLQPLALANFLLQHARFDPLVIGLSVAFEHNAHGRLQLGRFMFEVSAGLAFFLGSVHRRLDAEGEHLPADQTLAVANDQHLAEDPADVVAQFADEAGNGGKVQCVVIARIDKGGMFPAGAFDGPAADDALRVGS